MESVKVISQNMGSHANKVLSEVSFRGNTYIITSRKTPTQT